MTFMDPRLETLAGHLARMNSPQEDERTASERYLFEFFQTSPFEFVSLASSLVLRDDIPSQIIHAALVCIGRSLSPASELMMIKIRQTFLDPANAESREVIKQAVFRGIMYDSPGIRSVAAHCIDLTLRILQAEWIDVFPGLNSLAGSSSYQDCARQGAVCAFRELLLSKHVPLEPILEQVHTMFIFVDNVLGRPGNYSPGIHRECCLILPVLLNKIVEIHDEAQVSRDLHLIEMNIKSDDFEVFKAMIRSVSNIFKRKYASMTRKMLDAILHLSGAGFRSQVLSYQVATLVLWSGMAKYEMKIASQGVTDSVFVIEHCASTLFPILCEFMGLLSLEIDLNEIDYSDPPFVAVECLSNVYGAAPVVVGNMIEERWRTRSGQDWQSHASSVLSLVAMMSSRAKDRPETTHFLDSHFTDILEYCSSQTPLAYFCFQIVAKAISRYHIGMEYVNNGKLLECVVKMPNKRPEVIGKSLSIVNSICKISDRDDEDSPLGRFFGPIVEFVNALMKASSGNLKREAVICMACIISFLPNSKSGNDNGSVCSVILSEVEGWINEMVASGQIGAAEAFPVLVSYCDLMSAVANRLGVSVAPFADRIMNLVFELLRVQRSLYEESTTVMSSMALALREDFARYYDALRPLLQSMVKSGNSQVTISALSVLSDIFTAMGRLIVSDVGDILNLLFTLIDEGASDWQLLVKTVGTINDGMSIQGVEDILPLFLPRLFDAIGKILTNVSAATDTPERYHAVKESFSVILDGLIIVVKNSDDEAFLNANLNHFFTAINKFIASGVFCRETLLPFFEFLKVMASKYGSRISIKLSRRNITDTLRKAQNMPEVAERASEVLDFLKHYK